MLELKTTFEQLQVQPGLAAFVESLKVGGFLMYEPGAGHIPTDLPSEPCTLAYLSTGNDVMLCYYVTMCHLSSKPLPPTTSNSVRTKTNVAIAAGTGGNTVVEAWG